eukprot:c26928_g1_i1 orf=395-2326(+)
MASAMLINYDDLPQDAPAPRTFSRRKQTSAKGPSPGLRFPEGMPELDNVAGRSLVTARKASAIAYASPGYKAKSDDSSSLNRKSMSLNADVGKYPWRSFRDSNPIFPVPVSEMNREERRVLRRRLKQELQQIRDLSLRIEVGEQRLRGQTPSIGVHSSYSDAQFSGNDARSCVGKEVTSGLDSVPARASVPFWTDTGHALQITVDASLGATDSSLKEKRTPKANQLYRKSEFVMGNDKMPPLEKLKSKSGAGNKRGSMTKVDGRDSKRPAMANSFQSRQFVDIMRQCGNLLKMLMRHKHGWVFNDPVDAQKLGLSDYHLVIRKPMDLGTVKGKLGRKEYTSPLQFAEEVRLTFSNAMTYNPRGNDVHAMADGLLRMFEEKWKFIEDKYEERQMKNEEEFGVLEQQQSVRTLLLSPTQTYHPQSYHKQEDSNQSQTMPKKAPSGKKPAPPKPKPKPKPKMQQPKREMSFLEKKRLSGNLQLLPADKLEYIVQLMKERNPNLSQKDDEIEVDIDTFDKDTLWELHHYVANCMKSMGRNKKKSGQNQADQSSRAPKNQVAMADGAGGSSARNRKGGEAGDEDVDIDDGLPNASFPPVEIDKDTGYASRSSSSGSSSSDSGSSSDSDSGSSSGSESDAEDAESADRG